MKTTTAIKRYCGQNWKIKLRMFRKRAREIERERERELIFGIAEMILILNVYTCLEIKIYALCVYMCV